MAPGKDIAGPEGVMADQDRSAAKDGGAGDGRPQRDKPWMIRTYGGHSSAKASNELYRKNLAAGQTGLSVAFDLPTQTGYDSDHELSRGEVGKVGVPVAHLGDMRMLFDAIPLETIAPPRCGGRAGLLVRPPNRHVTP